MPTYINGTGTQSVINGVTEQYGGGAPSPGGTTLVLGAPIHPWVIYDPAATPPNIGLTADPTVYWEEAVAGFKPATDQAYNVAQKLIKIPVGVTEVHSWEVRLVWRTKFTGASFGFSTWMVVDDGAELPLFTELIPPAALVYTPISFLTVAAPGTWVEHAISGNINMEKVGGGQAMGSDFWLVLAVAVQGAPSTDEIDVEVGSEIKLWLSGG